MKIDCTKISKRFIREWIFKDLSYSFETNKAYALTGTNGSGKSTFLKVLAGLESFHKGSLTITSSKGKTINPSELFKHISYVAPYQSLIEELTLKEHLSFHEKMMGQHLDHTFIKELRLEKSYNKEIKNFSSGMKQRLKLGLAFYSHRPLLLLDEPTSNLDQSGIDWYLSTIQKFVKKKTIIVASNDPNEYSFCDNVLSILDFKPKAK